MLPQPTTNRGNATAELGRHEEAIADYDEAIRINPGICPSLLPTGELSKNELGRHEEAIADYNRSNPTSTPKMP